MQNTTLLSITVRGSIIAPSCWHHVATHRVARYRPAMCDAPWPRVCRSATRGARIVANPQRVMFVGDAHTYRTGTPVGRHVRRCAKSTHASHEWYATRIVLCMCAVAVRIDPGHSSAGHFRTPALANVAANNACKWIGHSFGHGRIPMRSGRSKLPPMHCMSH